MTKIKHILISILAVISMLLLGVNYTAYANTNSIFAYTGSIIHGFASSDISTNTITIPAEIETNKITSIEKGSFGVSFGSPLFLEKITQLDLSQATNLTEIGSESFQGLSITQDTLVLPDKLISIKKNNFNACTFNKVIVTGTSPISIASSAFKQGTKFIFPSETVMNDNINSDNDWTKYYTPTYYIDLVLNIPDQNPISLGQYEYGSTIHNYDEIITTYFSDYETVVLKQDGNIIDSNTQILSDEPLALDENLSVKKEVEIEIKTDTIPLQFTYGEQCVITSDEVGNYTWKYKNEVVATTQSLNLTLESGTYTYILEVKDNETTTAIITYIIEISPIHINYPWGALTRYEYYDIINHNFLKDEYKDLVTIEIYKGSEISTAYSIGTFTAKATPNDNKNYVIDNNEFDFVVDYTYLTLTWSNNSFNYTGQNIIPTYTLSGNKHNFDIELIPGEGSTEQASEVGNYTYYIDGLDEEYFQLAQGTPTTFNWSIISTQLEIVWSNNQFTYTGETIVPTAIGKYGNDISIDLVVSCDEDIINVGTYNITASVPSNYTGFTLSNNTTSTCTVIATMLNISFNCPTEYVYSGQYYEIIPNISTNILQDINLTLIDNKHKDAGKYICKIDSIDNPNYILPDNLTLEWEILPKILEVNWKASRYEYNTYVIIPNPSVNTDIAGETLELKVTCDNNINVNEDSINGYPISVSISNPNYKLSNPTSEYWITRAIPYIYGLHTEESYVYTGEYFIPQFNFVGDSGYLQMFVNGIMSDNGVKDVGTYQLSFSAPQSPNYKAMSTYYCNVRIKRASVEKNIDTTTITAINNDNGFNDELMTVVEVNEYENKTLNVENSGNYDIYKVLNVNNIENEENNRLSIEIENINANRLRIFVLEGDTLVEKQVTISDNKVLFDGGNGTYFILLAKPKWITTPVGILTIIALLLAVCAVLTIPFFKKNAKSNNEKKIQEETKRKIAEKLKNEESSDNTSNNYQEKTIDEFNNESEKTD